MRKQPALVFACALLAATALSSCESTVNIDRDYRLKSSDGEIAIRFERLSVRQRDEGQLLHNSIRFRNDGKAARALKADVWQVVRLCDGEPCVELRVFVRNAPPLSAPAEADDPSAPFPFEVPEKAVVAKHLRMTTRLAPGSDEAFVLNGMDDIELGRVRLYLQWLDDGAAK